MLYNILLLINVIDVDNTVISTNNIEFFSLIISI